MKIEAKINDLDKTSKRIWHPPHNIFISDLKKFSSLTLLFTETIMGCGVAQMHGCSNFHILTKEECLELKEFFLTKYTSCLGKLSNTQCGLIICTLGESYYQNEKNLLLCGFERMSEYKNPRHNPISLQRIYGLKTTI